MTIYEQIEAKYQNIKELLDLEIIVLQNDSDGKGDYIAVWNYEKPLPDGLTLGKKKEL